MTTNNFISHTILHFFHFQYLHKKIIFLHIINNDLTIYHKFISIIFTSNITNDEHHLTKEVIPWLSEHSTGSGTICIRYLYNSLLRIQKCFHFDGERHDFWEFQCVDKGAAEVITDNGTYTLTRSQVIFHRPNEFHTLKANGRTAPNIIVISFACNSPCMKFFENKILDFPIPNEVFWDALLRKQETVLLLPWIIHILKK